MKELLEQYEVVQVHKYENWSEPFCARYVDLYAKYDYILGDLSAGVLRLTGFYHSNYEKEKQKHLKKRCAYDAPFFILKLIQN